MVDEKTHGKKERAVLCFRSVNLKFRNVFSYLVVLVLSGNLRLLESIAFETKRRSAASGIDFRDDRAYT